MSASGRNQTRREGREGARSPGTHTKGGGILGPQLPAIQQGRHTDFIQFRVDAITRQVSYKSERNRIKRKE